MIEIKINNEIRSVKADVMAGLSVYELAFAALGAAAGVAAGGIMYFELGAGITFSAYAAIIAAVPFAFMGFFRWHEMTGIDIIKNLARQLAERSTTTYGGENGYYGAYTRHAGAWKRQLRKEARADAISHITQRFKRQEKKAA